MAGNDNSAPEVKLNGATPPPSAGGEAPRKRGRPPGSGKKLGETPVGESAPRGKAKRPQVEYDREAVAKQLKGTHYLVGMSFSMPELFLSDEQALELAEVMIGMAREYDFEPDSKVMAALNFAATAGFIYVPKIIKIAQRVKSKRPAGSHAGKTIDGEATPVPDGASTVN